MKTKHYFPSGVKKFSMALSTSATLGTWTVFVSCGGNSWTGAVNVSRQGSGTGNVRDVESGSSNAMSRSPAAEVHYVELRFAPTTKRWYKPGLSFKGKVIRSVLLDCSTQRRGCPEQRSLHLICGWRSVLASRQNFPRGMNECSIRSRVV